MGSRKYPRVNYFLLRPQENTGRYLHSYVHIRMYIHHYATERFFQFTNIFQTYSRVFAELRNLPTVRIVMSNKINEDALT